MKFRQRTPHNRQPAARRPQLEQLEQRWVRAGLPYGAMANDTGEFMLGKVAVTPVFLESNGVVDTSTENWNPTHVAATMARITEGLDWWKQLLATKTSVHTLDWIIDRTYVDAPTPTAYEPINRTSNDYSLWTQEFLMRIGYAQSTSLEENMRSFNNAQRLKSGADWSFTIFVVNSEVDGEGTFANGGSFSRAFAFAGGLFSVIPSTRPASTFAHETGHMFWARDEYAGGGSYYAERGYYNTQNSNAIDNNPIAGFQQQPSIMSAGAVLDTAYSQVINAASSLAMLGWQDSDGDGIFDVLDVPLSLDGVGRVDVNSGSYRFIGKAKVQTLPNKNTSGLGNDITLNRVSQIQARVNGGPWQVFASPNSYETNVDISIPLVGATSGTIEIRAIDTTTNIVSNLFSASISAQPETTPSIGINGFVWNDANANGQFDAIESGLGAQTVRLVTAGGVALNLQRTIDADSQVPGPISSTAFSGVIISAVGSDASGGVGSFADTMATTGARVFRPFSSSQGSYVETWNNRRQLKVEFNARTSLVAVDVIGASTESYGRLELYDVNGNLLDRVTSPKLRLGQSYTLELGRDTSEIAYAIVRGHMSSSIKIDNFRFGPKTQTTTDTFGRYSFTNLPSGNYNVQLVLSGITSQVTSSAGPLQSISLAPLATEEHVDYGINFSNTAWHNTQRAYDVNDDGNVTAFDALLVINLINQGTPSLLSSSGLPSKPYVDTSNDGFLTALDALLVINAINAASGEGEIAASALACSAWDAGAATGVADGEGPVASPAVVAEGEKYGPALPIVPPISSLEISSVDMLDSEGESTPTANCVVDQLAYELQLQERLKANPWSLPQPCNCPECLATELTSIRATP